MMADGLMEDLEYEGLSGDEEKVQISGYVQERAQEVFQQLESWMKHGALTESMVEPMIELLNKVFMKFQHYYVKSLQVDQLAEEKETLQQSRYTMRQKYQSTVEVCVCMCVCMCTYVYVCYICVYLQSSLKRLYPLGSKSCLFLSDVPT